MNFKIIIKYILLVLWMILIFWFSSQVGVLSSQMSDGIVSCILSMIEKAMNISLKNNEIFVSFVFYIRKLAHFSLYFVLGILWMILLKEYNISIKKQFIYAMLFCLIYACSDEIHQLFVPGRSGKIFDVMVDWLGALCSIIPICFIRRHRMKTV